jgi:glycosyltransferase involved in cell wall biosynthesis
MKVCFATYDSPPHLSGGNLWMQRLLPRLQMAGIELEVHLAAIGGKPGYMWAFFKEHKIPVRWMPAVTHLPSEVQGRLRFLEQAQPDIYVPWFGLSALYAAAYARRAGIATVGVLLSDDGYVWGIVDQFVNGDPDIRLSAVVPCSALLESLVDRTAAARGVVVRRIANGVPVPARTAAQVPGSVFRLVYTGRLVEEAKRISDVVKALCAATQNIPNLEAWITGEGEARPTVEEIIRENGKGRVHLLGLVDDVFDVLAQCHGLVLLSDYEGLPMSVLEAMATGVVPICLDTRSGVREVIEHGVNGLIVKDRGADFLATVRGLQSDPAKWRRLSLAARETVEQRYSIEASAREWVDLLEHLNRKQATRGHFQTAGVLQVPSPAPRFWVPGKKELQWKGALARYLRAVPPLYQMAKETVTLARKMKSETTIRRYARRQQID